MNNGIYILSLPIQSGKTTLLLQWLKTITHAAGFLSPDSNGNRYLLNIGTGESRRFQLTAGEEGVKIGRFVFDPRVFEWGRQIILESLSQGNEWLIADEVGRLEMNQNQGWEPALKQVIAKYQLPSAGKKLLLVIRDYLLDEAVEKYHLQTAKVLPASFFLNKKSMPLNGLVLAGGESSRMGQPKAVLSYHNKPQFLYVAEHLQHFCNSVSISANIPLQHLTSHLVIPDAPQYTNAGPIGGILSAICENPAASLLVTGCDYPYLQRQDLLQLFNEYSDENEAICFRHPESEMAEPLIAIYHLSCFEKMRQYFNGGGQSLRKFLLQINTKFIDPKQPQALKSHDTPEDYLTFNK